MTRRSMMTLKGLVLGSLIAVLTSQATWGADHFQVTVPTGSDFTTLVDFWTPLGVSLGAKSVIRIVTDNTTVGDLTFRIEPELTSSFDPGNSRAPVTFTVGAAGTTDLVESPNAKNVAPTIKACVVDLTADPLLCLDTPPASNPAASGFLMVDVTVEYDGTYDFQQDPDPADQAPGLGEKWTLKIEQLGGSAHEYFGLAGAGVGEVTQPKMEAWIDAPYDERVEVQFMVRSDEAPLFPVEARNIGTGPLDIDGAALSSDAHFKRPVFGTPDILPGATMINDFVGGDGLWIQIRPQAMGDIDADLTVTPNAGDPQVFPLRARGVNLYAHLLMDCSGSMGGALADSTKLAYAAQAGTLLNNWIHDFSSGQAYIGLSTFPDCPNTVLSEVLVNINLAATNQDGVNNDLTDLEEQGGHTPMQQGIEAARDDMTGRIGILELDAVEPLLKKGILLLSDGWETSVSNALSTTSSLENNDIRLYTVPYGDDADIGLLGQLATDTEGLLLSDPEDPSQPVDATRPSAVKQAFKQAASEWLGLETVADPQGQIRAGQQRTHTACVDEDAYGVTFSVDWNRFISGGVVLTLTSPTGETITPSSSDVTFNAGDSYAMYVLQGDRIRAGAGAGEWTLNLTGGSGLPGGEDTEYSWDVLVKSPVKAAPNRRWGILTGDLYLIEVALSGLEAHQLADASLVATFEAPTASFNTYLAASEVDRNWFFTAQQLGAVEPDSRDGFFTSAAIAQQPEQDRVQAVRVPLEIGGEPATLAQRKLWALENLADKPFTSERSTGQLQLYDDGTNGDRIAGDGIFSATTTQLQYEGLYHHELQLLTPNLARRECVERHFKISDFVDVMLSPALIVDNVVWQAAESSLFFDPEMGRRMTSDIGEGNERSAVIVTPKDELGNYWGMGRADQVRFEVEGGTLIADATIDNADGSYVAVIEHRRGERPSVVIDVGGITSPSIPMKKGGIGLLGWLLILLLIIVIVIVVVAILRRS